MTEEIRLDPRKVALLVAGLDNARTAINLALATMDWFCEEMKTEAVKKPCEHPDDKLENISGMGERPTYLCTVCKEMVMPREDEGEEKEIGNGEDRS